MSRATGFRIYGAAAGGGGGGGSSTFNQYTIGFTKLGPASYSTGGIDIDLSDTFSSINSGDVVIKKGTRGNCGIGDIQFLEDTPSAGHVTLKILKDQYTKVTAMGSVTNQPSGVTLRVASGGASGAEAAHTHDIDHNHPSFTSAAPTAAGAGVASVILNPSMSTHTHDLDLPNLTGTSGAGTSHSHVDNTLYTHSHDITHTSTGMTLTEIANATNLSTTTFIVRVTGVRA